MALSDTVPAVQNSAMQRLLLGTDLFDVDDGRLITGVEEQWSCRFEVPVSTAGRLPVVHSSHPIEVTFFLAGGREPTGMCDRLDIRHDESTHVATVAASGWYAPI